MLAVTTSFIRTPPRNPLHSIAAATDPLIRKTIVTPSPPPVHIHRRATMASNVNGNGDNGDPGHLEGEHNQWKFRAPYRVHENDPSFHVRYEGSCHCGRVKYQLSREKPLAAKYCHCTTCQKLHGPFTTTTTTGSPFSHPFI